MTEGINVGDVYTTVLPDARQFNTRMAEIARNAAVMVKVDADTAAARARIDELSGGDVKVHADVDDEEARIRLDELTRTREAKINVDADTAGAEANIARLNQSANGAGSGLGAMTTAALTLGPALVPVGAAALGVAAALASLGVAGIAGLGVLTIAIGGVGNAVKLLGQQQTQQASAANAAGQSAAAQAQAVVSAQRQIESARMSLADAQRSAADQQIQDSQSVQSAQYALAQADQQETNAVNALVTAREAASRQLESYANQAVDARLAEQQAVISLETAQQNYNNTMASTTATQVQRQQAALDLQKAQQGIIETQQAATNAAQDNAKAQQAGVDGAPQVVSATQAVTSAQHNQQQAVQNLADAQRKAAEDQIKSQESIVRAQQGVAAAMDAMAAAQRSAAGSSNAALAATNAQIAKLDPATRSFAEYIRGTLAPVWHGLTGTIATGLFPGMQAGIEAMMPDLPILTRFLSSAATAMGDLFRAAGQALASPFWQNFFTMLANNIGPWLTALGTIFGDLITGFAGLFQAMQPVAQVVIPGIVRLADGFAKFGASAGSSSGFQKVLEYIKANMPVVGQLIGGLVTLVGHIIAALAPIGPPILAVLNSIIGLLNKIPTRVLTEIALGVMAIVTAQKLISPIGALLGAVSDANPVVLILAAIAGAFALVYTNSKTFRDFIANQVLPTLKDWWQWISDHILPVLHDLWDFIVNHLVPVLAGIFMSAWHGIQDAVQFVSKIISDHRAELKQLWDVISAIVGFIVEHVLPLLGPILKAVFDALGIAIGVVIDIVSALIDAWNHMWQLGKDLGHWFANDFVNFFVGVWKAIRDGWNTLVTDIKNLWQDIEHWVMVPVAWVVRYIINDGLIKAWDWISDKLLGGALHANPMDVPTVPPLAAATGGVVPGYAPGIDSVNARLSPGEGILVPEAVRGLGGAPAIHAINAAYSSRVPGGGNHFSGGGIFGGIISASVPVAGLSAAIGGEKLADIINDPIAGFRNLVNGVMKGIGQIGPFVDMLGQMGLGLAKGLGGALLQQLHKFLVNSPNVPNISSSHSANVAIVQAAAKPYGWDTGNEWNALQYVVNRESGFNNMAQNPTSSAFGMFQFLDPTWGSFGLKTSDPTNQAKYGMEYIQSRYGEPSAAYAHEVAFGWYDGGGLLPPGPSLVYNGTGQPELVAPTQTFRDVLSGASGGSAGRGQGGPAVFHLYDVDNQLIGTMRGHADDVVTSALGLMTARGSNNPR